jgi:uncharacterized protein YuzE
VKIAVQLEPALGMPGEVSYRWDPDTDILSAQLPAQPGVTEGMSGSVGLEGSDGSWLILDVNEGRINGVEVAVWPDVRELAKLPLPSKIEDAAVTVPGRKSQPDIASVEMAARNIVAEADQGGKNFHFRMGKTRETRTIRLGKDLLLDLDEKSQISGLWLLNVPPCPSDS